MSALLSLFWDWLCSSFLFKFGQYRMNSCKPTSALSLKSSHLYIYLATSPVETWKTRVSSFFSCLLSLLPNSSSSHSNQSCMYTDLRLTFLRYVSETTYLSKTSQWLSTNYLTECKHLILTVKGRGAPGGFSSVSLQVSCIHRLVPVSMRNMTYTSRFCQEL